MTFKKGKIRGGILLTLFLIILTAVIAAGVNFAGARRAFADETPSVTVTEDTTVRDNSWKAEPDIAGWDFLKYSDNLTEGKATYGEANYSVLFNDAIKDPVNETLTGFVFGEGKLSVAVVNALKDLVKGDYILSATVPAGTATEEVTKTEEGKEVTEEVAFNYAGLKKEINFSVARGTNVWTENLSLTNTLGTENIWTYGSYSNATHTVSAKAEYGQVEFTVRNNSVVVVDAFVLDAGGDVPETAVKAINKLPIGDYTLRAEVKSTDNYTGLGEYANGTHQDVNFTITRATNRWIVAPRVNDWSFGSFNTAYIQAKPACGEDKMKLTLYALEKIDGETVTYKEKGPVSLGNMQSFYLEDGEIPRAIAVELNQLERGYYSFVATVPETLSYSGLNVGMGALDGVIFEVAGATNTWASTPNVVRWTWGGFDKSVNVFTAVPEYPFIVKDKKVTFGIYRDEDLNEPVENLSNFTTVTGTGYGDEGDDDTARLLAALPAGTYYLNARTLGGQSDSYSALNSVIQFTVAKARNYWTKTPQIVQWTWNGYDPAVNLISAVPAIGEPENIVFGVYFDENCNLPVSGLMTFSLVKKVDENAVRYELPEKIISALSELGAGGYYLKAEVAGTDDYSSLGSVSSFSVQRVNNFWLTTPSAQGWRYGSYDKQNNAIYAKPAFGGDAVFKIYYSDGTEVLFDNGDATVKEFKLEDGQVPAFVTDMLPKLGTGKYYVLASVAATGNYTGLNEYSKIEDIAAHGVELNITANANGWQIVPRVLGWTEGSFDIEKNKIFAEAACGNENLRVSVLDAKGNTVLSCAYTELDYDKLAGLDVGSYTVKLSVEGNNNYEALSGETTFAVTEDAVGLTGIITAVVVFGIFDIAAAAFCIYLVVSRRRKIEESFRNMIRKELHRR